MLKVSVLASGAVLLEGQPITLAALEEALKTAKENDAVGYYREQASGEPSPQAMEVIRLVVKYKLPITLSTKPDFSDYVDAAGSHPRDQAGGGPDALSMPEIEERSDIEEIFTKVRKTATGEAGSRGLVIVLPDRKYLVLPPLPETPAMKAAIASVERLVPSAVKRNVAVIGHTVFATPTLADVNKSIPFFGVLMGLSCIGHALWIFEGHASAFAAGCRDADILLVDSGMLPYLHGDWPDTALTVMRNPNILCYDRSTFQLKVIRKAGEAAGGRLEFPRRNE